MKFAKEEGMILELSRYEYHSSFYFNCSILSIYDDEQEYLFFSGETILQIVTIKNIDNGV